MSLHNVNINKPMYLLLKNTTAEFVLHLALQCTIFQINGPGNAIKKVYGRYRRKVSRSLKENDFQQTFNAHGRTLTGNKWLFYVFTIMSAI